MRFFWIITYQFIISILYIGWIYAFENCLSINESNKPALLCLSAVFSLPFKSPIIPPNITKLRISGVSARGRHNGVLASTNLTGLETLTYLEIENFGLEQIESNTFLGLKQLKVLDLSKNRIYKIHPNAFAGPLLDRLSLTDNKALDFDLLSFRGARIFHLIARDCNLKRFDYDIVAQAKPKQLSLSDNHLTSLDPRFATLIGQDNDLLRPNSRHRQFGYLDLSNNPLDCSCQLVWLSRLIESQMYKVHQFLNVKDADFKPTDASLINATAKDGSIRLMHQMNMTCASPQRWLGKRLPRSWDYECPTPQVTGIEVNLIDVSTGLAQLTCVGLGRPLPSLAWTYQLNGQKVQQILNSVGDNSLQRHSWHEPHFDDGTKLYEQKLRLNVSLQYAQVKNYTCTAWNNDNQLDGTTVRPTTYQPFSTNAQSNAIAVPSLAYDKRELAYYRIHEVSVRILTKSKSLALGQANLKNAGLATKQTPTSASKHTNNNLVHLRHEKKGDYNYLFVKRFTLLELLGAIVGTFVCTLILLYLVTNCFAWFCHLQPCGIKKTHMTNKPSTKWFGWMKDHHHRFLLRSENHSGSSSTSTTNQPSKMTNAFKHADMDPSSVTSPMLAKFGTNNKQTIPQALLLGGIPNPPVDANPTPPPNPAYWSMPEYVYSGTNSHEYDVPRPIETILGDKFRCQNNTSQNTAQSFLSLTHNLDPQLNSSNNLSSMSMQWAPNHGSLINPLVAWNSSLNHPAMGAPCYANNRINPLQNIALAAQALNSQQMFYSPDYPTYLQTRPYPQSLQNQNAPVLVKAPNSHSANYEDDQHPDCTNNSNDGVAKDAVLQNNTQMNGIH